jgi:hypothetical protein
MPCYCGDTQCRSCGPAQGNRYCEVCCEWQDDFDAPGSMHNEEECSAIAKVWAEEEAKIDYSFLNEEE